ncbi:MAG: HEAT repeat domain-containing protein [Elusimicrobia bacterium]|nr:HEAT repeat domain-containing protein [Elusimicrobiota bacterium]MDY6039901.1 HEAT repeat domain-containing protein [Elusimicrobiaceae bacterium]
MTKQTNVLLLTALLALTAQPLSAATALETALPLLQKNRRTAAENQQVLTVFRTAKDPDTVFAAGASLVKTPPAKAQEPALLNLVMRSDDPLKQTFAAVILTSMGQAYDELSPILQEALTGKDPALRAYAAGGYAFINPQDDTHASETVRLYIFDPAFAQRAMNQLATDAKQQAKFLKTASTAEDAQLRAAAAAWLGTLHTQDAAKQLLKMAKTEKDPQVATQIATGLAKNREATLDDAVKELRRNYNTPQAATYALALGFMTGNAVDALRRGLADKNENVRINSARAAAYMAGVLSNPDAFTYSSDRTFDIGLLKSLIPALTLRAKTGSDAEKIHAENALRQIEKLME